MNGRTVAETVSALHEGDRVRIFYETGACITGVVSMKNDGPVIYTKADSKWWINITPDQARGISSVDVLHRAEPCVGTVVECTGCGSRHHRMTAYEQGWLTEVKNAPRGAWRTWAEVIDADDCGTIKIVYDPEKP